jgi:hypothetical protein
MKGMVEGDSAVDVAVASLSGWARPLTLALSRRERGPVAEFGLDS